MTDQPRRLYRHPLSGHSHRAQLMLSLLGLKAELVEVDLLAKAQKAPDYLVLNSMGQVPVLQDGDVVIADSNAVLVYLALRYGTAWYPTDPLLAARVQRWLSLAAGELSSGPAAARLINVFKLGADKTRPLALAEQLFRVMEADLTAEAFLAGSAPTIADIALYTYTAHAPEGDVPLDQYPAIRAWLARIEALPGFVPMVRVS